MATFFSIIIPVYNVAPYLRACLDSVLRQSFHNWEAICIDDGSTDDSGTILAEYAKKDSRIKVVRQINSGVVAARLTGFCNSCGDWVLLLDGDDELERDCLPVLYRILCKCDAEMIQFGYETVDQKGVRSLCLPKINAKKSFNWVLHNSVNSPLNTLGMCIGNKCYRRDLVKKVFDEVGCVRISHSEDGLFAFAAFLHMNNIIFLREPFYRYNIRSNSALHKVNTSIVSDKSIFLENLKLLANKSKRMPRHLIDTMVDFHSYQACCYIFLMLTRNRATVENIIKILTQLKSTTYFKNCKKNANSFKRRLMYRVVESPALYILIQKLGLIK